MKKIFLILITSSLLFSSSCKKGEVISDVNSLEKGAYVTLVKNNNLRLDYANINNTSASITVKDYGNPIEKIKIFVTKGTATADKTKWKIIKEVPNTGETDLTVKATEIATALGVPPADIAPGGTYTLYNQVITKDGKIFDLGNTNGTFAGNSNYKMALSWSVVVVCPFVPPAAGKYKVITDGWEDWATGSTVDVLDGPAGSNQVDLSKVWPNPDNGTAVSPFFIIKVDPATGAVTIPTGKWGDYTSYIAETGAAGTEGYVFTCTGDIILNVRIVAPPFGDQGVKKLILKKL